MAASAWHQNKIHPGDPADKNLYDLPPEESQADPDRVPVPEEARWPPWTPDREFLTRGGVFSNDFIRRFTSELEDGREVNKTRMTAHPVGIPDEPQPVIRLLARLFGQNPRMVCRGALHGGGGAAVSVCRQARHHSLPMTYLRSVDLPALSPPAMVGPMRRFTKYVEIPTTSPIPTPCAWRQAQRIAAGGHQARTSHLLRCCPTATANER